MSSGGIGPDGMVYCKHMEEAAKRRSGSAKNPDRDYYCCRRYTGDPNRCNFWHWADQVPRLVNPSTSSAVQSPTPRPSKEGGARARPIATPSARTSQQQFSPSKNSTDSPQRRKRMEDIEAGLQQREQDMNTNQAGPSRERGASTSPSGVQASPQPPSPVPTEVDVEVETRPRKSFLGLPDSPELNPSTIKEEGQPSTPKKRRITPPTEGTEVQPAARGVSFGDGLLLTPPETTRRAVQSNGFEPVSPILYSRKGKEREGVPPVRTPNQDGFCGEPQEDTLPLFTHLEDASSTSSVSPTVAENVLDYNDGIKARVKALSEYMDSFDVTRAGKALQTIERQKIQYEYRDRSQKMRIGELTAEKDRLVAEVSRLKEALKRSEERGRVEDYNKASGEWP